MTELEDTQKTHQIYGIAPTGVFVSGSNSRERFDQAGQLGVALLLSAIGAFMFVYQGWPPTWRHILILVGVLALVPWVVSLFVELLHHGREQRIEIDFDTKTVRLTHLFRPHGFIPRPIAAYCEIALDEIDRAYLISNYKRQDFDAYYISTDHGEAILRPHLSDFDAFERIFERYARRPRMIPVARNPFAQLGLCLLVAFVVVSWSLANTNAILRNPQAAHYEFDREHWIESSPLGRQRMANDLIATQIVIGETKDGVAYLLGPADENRRPLDTTAWDSEMWYYLDMSFDSKGQRADLRITFDASGVATSAQVITH